MMAPGTFRCWHAARTAAARLLLGALLSLVAACGSDLPTVPEPEPDGPLAEAATISAGSVHTCAIAASGRLYCWGAGGPQLGAQTTELCDGTGCSTTPVAVTGGLRFTSVAAGDAFTCGIAADSRVHCWGSNWAGLLGTGDTVSRAAPTPIASDRHFDALAAGSSHSCALDREGRAHCWGYAGPGTPDYVSHTPQPVPGSLGLRVIAVGRTVTCGLTGSGEPHCWSGGGRPAAPLPLAGGVRLRSIAVGDLICGISLADEPYCWASPAHAPVRIDLPVTPVRVAARGATTCWIGRSAETFCWPDRGPGGSPIDRFFQVPGEHRVLTLGNSHGCSLAGDGAARCWGWNRWGQLGNGTTVDAPGPVQVAGGISFRLP